MRKSVIMLILAAMVCIFSGCSTTEQPPNTEDLGQLLSFSYSYGSYHQGYWFYDFSRTEDGEILFTAEGHNGVEMNLSTTVDQDVLDGIAAVIEEQEIYKWNGQHRSGSIVDGWGFSISAEFENGNIEAGASTVESGDGGALGDHLWQLAESLK